MAIAGIIFDLDGTLLDTLADLESAVNRTMERHGFPARTREEIRSFVGNGVAVLVEKACPEGTSREEALACLAEFRQDYYDHVNVDTLPYEGIPDLLRRCRDRGLKIGVASNKFESAVQLLCDEWLKDLVDEAVGDLPGWPRKPDPANLYRCMEKMGIQKKEQILYVGDSETDIRTGRNAGVYTIAVSWGFRDRSVLEREEAQEICDDIGSLWDRISSIILE